MRYRYELVPPDAPSLGRGVALGRASRRALLRRLQRERRDGRLTGAWQVVRVALEEGEEMYRAVSGHVDADGTFTPVSRSGRRSRA